MTLVTPAHVEPATHLPLVQQEGAAEEDVCARDQFLANDSGSSPDVGERKDWIFLQRSDVEDEAEASDNGTPEHEAPMRMATVKSAEPEHRTPFSTVRQLKVSIWAQGFPVI